ncbi:MAG: glycoside hydrolase family 31 protein, partial [Deltaproteobacteria bacterium]|nr:glycoside hydrolase family 31 protein [Deltaproteobacteria bacterium]
VDALDDRRSYDPVFLDTVSVQWEAPRSATVVEEGEGGLEVALDYGEWLTAVLTVEERAEGRFSATLVPDEGAAPFAFVRLRARVDPAEGFYGLGEVFDTPEHRGKTRAMQIELESAVESANNEAHVPVPLLIGTTGWGLFVQDFHPALFEVATEADDLVQVTVGTGMDSADGLAFHLYGSDHPLDVTRHYYETTGYPLLPAPWALGPVLWRDENDDQAQFENDLETARDLDLATTGTWIDRPYASGVNTFDFDPERFPDPEAMIDRAHALGVRMALWHVPYADPVEAPEVYAEAVAGGYFPPEAPPAFNDWSQLIDLTNPEAYGWWQELIRRYTDMGIEGFKLDYAEDVVLGLNGGRLPWRFSDGTDERTMHARYPLLYHQVYAETLPEEGGFLLVRAGTWGDQVHGSIVWPGDIDANLAEPYQEMDGYVAVGGLPAAVVAGNSLGPSGFPFFGSDTGGYLHAPPDKETFSRWFEHTALSSVMQVGTNTNDVPWEFEEDNGFDEEMLGWYRTYARLHLRLFPYAWTYAERLAEDGRPLQRPLGLAFPDLGVHPRHDYLFGDFLLVAPVVHRGERTRDVVFPEGRWIDWFTGEVFAGPAERTVDAPLDKLPLFLAEGGIVPLLRPTIDAMAPTTEPERVDSFATDPGVLYPRVFPGPASRFEVYDGAVISQVKTEDGVRLVWTDGEVFTEGAVFEVVGLDAAPAEVRLDGAALDAVEDPQGEEAGWAWEDGLLRVRVPGGTHRVEVR